MLVLFGHMIIFHTIIPDSFCLHIEPLSSYRHILPHFLGSQFIPLLQVVICMSYPIRNIARNPPFHGQGL